MMEVCEEVKQLIAEPMKQRTESLSAECIRFSQKVLDFRKNFLAEAPFRLLFAPEDAYKVLDSMWVEVNKLQVSVSVSLWAATSAMCPSGVSAVSQRCKPINLRDRYELIPDAPVAAGRACCVRTR